MTDDERGLCLEQQRVTCNNCRRNIFRTRKSVDRLRAFGFNAVWLIVLTGF